MSSPRRLVEKLVAICKHELRLEEKNDITRLVQEVNIIQEDSNDIYARLSNEHKINAREIMSGYMLAWEYVVDASGSGQGFWKKEMSRPNALVWPEDKKKILAGVEKMFIELQDYPMKKRKSTPSQKSYQEGDAEYTPPPPIAPSTIRSPTKRSEKKDRQPKTDVAPVLSTAAPSSVVPITQDTELDQQPSSQKQHPEKAASKISYDGSPMTPVEGSVTNDSTKVSSLRKTTLTPPYIPEKGLHQTWPGFGYEDVSQGEGRTLRSRTKKFDDLDETTPKTSTMSPDERPIAPVEGPVTIESTKVSSPGKRTLTPPYIPEKGLHQTWPGFGYKDVSQGEGRTLRSRTKYHDDSDEKMSDTSTMSPNERKRMGVKANLAHNSAKKHSSTVPAESSDEEHISDRIWKPSRKSRLLKVSVRKESYSVHTESSEEEHVGDQITIRIRRTQLHSLLNMLARDNDRLVSADDVAVKPASR